MDEGVGEPAERSIVRYERARAEGDSVVYRGSVLAALASGAWNELTEQAARRALQILRANRREALAPTWSGAGRCAARTLFFIVAPLALAEQLRRAGHLWVVPPLVLIAGMACCGAVAIVHDLAHGSFLPSRRANRVIGQWLAPCVLLEFSAFQRSHLEHHRLSQSVADPKRFGASHSREADAPGYRTLDHIPWFFAKLVQLGASVRDFPLRLRHFLYLCVSPIFFGPAVLLGSGEFSLLRRDFRRFQSWLSLLQSSALLFAIGRYSLPLLACSLAAMIIGYNFVFYVFTTHLSPNQAYWTETRRATVTDALNVSDVRCGALLRWLGNGFSDHHSTHHLSPAVPSYRLARAEAMIVGDVEPHRAPYIELLEPASCAFLYDNFFQAIVLTNAESWDYAARGAVRAVGGGARRTAAIGPAAPASQQP